MRARSLRYPSLLRSNVICTSFALSEWGRGVQKRIDAVESVEASSGQNGPILEGLVSIMFYRFASSYVDFSRSHRVLPRPYILLHIHLWLTAPRHSFFLGNPHYLSSLPVSFYSDGFLIYASLIMSTRTSECDFKSSNSNLLATKHGRRVGRCWFFPIMYLLPLILCTSY